MNDLLSRRYESRDFTRCLAIFDGNVPDFFAIAERAEFVDFLAGAAGGRQPYLVLIRNGLIVACGGLMIEAGKTQASLAWGMVERTRHGRGLGRHLTQARLALAQADPGITEVTLATSQHTQGFYAGFGFTVATVTTDGFAPGLDRWDMILRLK